MNFDVGIELALDQWCLLDTKDAIVMFDRKMLMLSQGFSENVLAQPRSIFYYYCY